MWIYYTVYTVYIAFGFTGKKDLKLLDETPNHILSRFSIQPSLYLFYQEVPIQSVLCLPFCVSALLNSAKLLHKD